MQNDSGEKQEWTPALGERVRIVESSRKTFGGIVGRVVAHMQRWDGAELHEVAYWPFGSERRQTVWVRACELEPWTEAANP